MNTETITRAELESLWARLGSVSSQLNERHRGGSRKAITTKVTLNLMEVAALEIALYQLIEHLPTSNEPDRRD